MQQKKKSSRVVGSTTTLIVGGLTSIMLVLWYIMHSMVVTPPASHDPSSASAISSVSSATYSAQSSIRGSSSRAMPFSKHAGDIQPISEGVPSLTHKDVELLSSVLGPKASNFTTGVFITIPDWVTKDPEAGMPPPPCLYAKLTGYNIYLFEEGWRDASPVEEGSSAQCPLPKGGQLPLQKDEVPTVSIVLAFRNMPTDTIRAIISILHCARQIDSIEILILDIASKDSDANEVKAFIQHLVTHLSVKVRLFRYGDADTASLSRAVSKATTLATGDHLVIMNCDVTLQYGALRAMLAVFSSHTRVGMVVPKFLQHSGHILDSGGLVFSDGSGWQYGHNEPTSRPQYNYIRPTDYGSSYCVMVHRKLFVKLGLYDTMYSPAWYDDTDAAFTIRKAGFNVYFTPFAEVIVDETADLVLTVSKPKLLETNRNKFQSRWSKELSCHYLHESVQSQYDAYIAATRLSSMRLLFLDWIVPEPDRDSGSIRTINMLQILLAMRVHVTFAIKDTQRDPSYTIALRYLGIEVVPIKELSYARSNAGGCRYDMIIVARREVYDDVFEKLQNVCLSAPKVFDTVDLHFMRENKEVLFKQTHDTELLKAVFGKNYDKNQETGPSSQSRELKYIEKSKVTVVVSEVETKEIRKFDSSATIVRISNIHADLDKELTPKPFQERTGCVFVGNWNHLPNRDAVLWFTQSILPLIHPKVDSSFVFHVIGANTMPPEIKALNNTKIDGVLRVIVHGFVADLKDFYGQMKMSVAPLRWGAGVKGKINSSMKYGVPVVCTVVSTEGMFPENRKNILAVEEGDAAAFAAAVVELYTDAELWQTVREGGIRNVKEHFSLSNAAGGMAEMLKLALLNENKAQRALDLGAKAITMDTCG